MFFERKPLADGMEKTDSPIGKPMDRSSTTPGQSYFIALCDFLKSSNVGNSINHDHQSSTDGQYHH